MASSPSPGTVPPPSSGAPRTPGLAGQVLRYAPANLVPAAASLAIVYVFTRLLSPEQYGLYALGMATVMAGQAVFFYWLKVGVTRSYEAAVRDGRAHALLATATLGTLAVSVALAVVFAVALTLLPLAPDLRTVLWIALPVVVLRALVAINLAVHRAALRATRYGLIEAAQAVLAVVFAWLLVSGLGLGAAGMMWGAAAAAAAVLLPDLHRVAAALRPRAADGTLAAGLARFGLPLTLSFALGFVLSTSDRFLLEALMGSEAVGIYSVAYALVERGAALTFAAVTLAAFPLAIRALERSGIEAGRAQMYRNGTALMALGIPACAGLALASDHLAAVLVGAEFRAGAAALMPWIALAAFLHGLKIHFFDHAFHLGRRTGVLVWTLVAPAVLNVALNLLLIPVLGLMGAVYATIAAYALALGLTIAIGRRVFQLTFPAGPALRVCAAVVPMAAVLLLVPFPRDTGGLLAMIAAGIATYGLAAVALDVAGTRQQAVSWLTATPRSNLSAEAVND